MDIELIATFHYEALKMAMERAGPWDKPEEILAVAKQFLSFIMDY